MWPVETVHELYSIFIREIDCLGVGIIGKKFQKRPKLSLGSRQTCD
jgi:hypothetical protein